MDLTKSTVRLVKITEALRRVQIPKIVFEASYVLLYLNHLLPSRTKDQLRELVHYAKQLLFTFDTTDNELETEQKGRLLNLLDKLDKLLKIRYSQVANSQDTIADIDHYKHVTSFASVKELYLAYVSKSTDLEQETEEKLLGHIENKLVRQIEELYTLLKLIVVKIGLLDEAIKTLEKADRYTLSELVSTLSNILFEKYEETTELRNANVQDELLTDLETIATIVRQDIETVYALPSLIHEIDFITKGFTPGTVVAFAGTLGTGKSGLLLDIALGLTVSSGLFADYLSLFWPHKYRDHKPIVIYITLENSRQLTNLRLLQILTDSDFDSIRNTLDLKGYVQQVRQEKQIPFTEYFAKLSGRSGLLIVDAVSVQFGLVELEQKIKEVLHAGYYPVAIVIDYMDEMYVPHSMYGEYRFKFGLVAQGLKSIAAKYNTVIITATQLNRKAIESGEISIAVLSESIEHAKRLDYIVGIRSESIPLSALYDPIEYINRTDRKRSRNNEKDASELDTDKHTITPFQEYTRVMLYATIKDRTTGSADSKIRYILSSPTSKFAFISQLYAPYLYTLSIYDSAILKSIERQARLQNFELSQKLAKLITSVENISRRMRIAKRIDPTNTLNPLVSLIQDCLYNKLGRLDLSKLTTRELYSIVKQELLTDDMVRTSYDVFDELVDSIHNKDSDNTLLTNVDDLVATNDEKQKNGSVTNEQERSSNDDSFEDIVL